MKDSNINIVLLHIIHESYYTGIERYIELYKKGISVYSNIYVHTLFFVDSKKVIFPKIASHAGVVSAIIPMPLNEDLMFRKDPFWKKKYWRVFTEIITPYLVGKENLIFHSHNTYLMDLAESLRNRFGGKFVIHLHCLPWKYIYNTDKICFNSLYSAFEKKEYALFKSIEDECQKYGIADKIICLSVVAKEYLTKIHLVDDNRVEIIVNGMELEENTEVLRSNDTVEILYVGKVSKDKGILNLLETLMTVQNKGYKFRLIIAGTCLNVVERYIYERYSNLDIHILGQVSMDELRGLYSTCTLGVIPSLYEQCSYVAIEMAMLGVPMIVSKVDALAEMFEHESTALLVPQSFDSDFGLSVNGELFAEYIIKLMENEALRSRLGKSVRGLYSREYTLEKMIHKTVSVYQQLLEQ